MEAVFDHAAEVYDKTFTNTHVGKMQRNQVWKLLENEVLKKGQLNILELNCGTGEDAIWLASKQHQVIATDLSPQMIEKANKKLESTTTSGNVKFEAMSITQTLEKYKGQKFDLVLSNFGGFNCLDPEELAKTMSTMSEVLQSNGIFVGVIMPKGCWIESLYFMIKGKFKTAFRRQSNEVVMANVEGALQPTFYYDPSFFKSLPKLKVKRIRPIGFFIPPSYLEPFFQPKKVLMRMLYNLENLFFTWSWLSKYSDHYYIQMQKRK